MDIAPPQSEAELLDRARALAGHTVGELGKRFEVQVPETAARAKGLTGQLLERALGCDAGSADLPDFLQIGVELKTLPIGRNGKPRESTFVCSISLGHAETETWVESRVLCKLRRVLWMPVEGDPALPLPGRRLGRPILWSPCADEEAALRADWELLMGMIACGQVEQISAHLGSSLQIRPKAAHSRVRTTGLDGEGVTRTLPLGFYLRPAFTARVLQG